MSHRLTASGQLERNSHCEYFSEIKSFFMREIICEDLTKIINEDHGENYSQLIVRLC